MSGSSSSGGALNAFLNQLNGAKDTSRDPATDAPLSSQSGPVARPLQSQPPLAAQQRADIVALRPVSDVTRLQPRGPNPQPNTVERAYPAFNMSAGPEPSPYATARIISEVPSAELAAGQQFLDDLEDWLRQAKRQAGTRPLVSRPLTTNPKAFR